VSKAKVLLKAWDFWQYIGGSQSSVPVITLHREPKQISSFNEEGRPSTISIPRNIYEYDLAVAAAEPWNNMNRKVLALILNAMPDDKTFLISQCNTANLAWKTLEQQFRPVNAECAVNIKKQIT
jgi:hypothetical protein